MHIRIKNIPLFVSGCALLCLLSPANTTGLAYTAAFMAMLLAATWFLPPVSARRLRAETTRPALVLSCIVYLILAVQFVIKWQPSSLIQTAAERIGLSSAVLLSAGAAFASVSVFFLLALLSACRRLTRGARSEWSAEAPPAKCGRGELILLAATAAAVITVCSKSSPLYPFNDWVDSNCFFTVAKAMANGQVLYRDIYEQKGPLLYIVHIPAYWVSHTSFLGAWLLEIAACFGFLFFSYRIIRLFCGPEALPAIPVLAAAVYTQQSFCHGDSAEELCLPLLSFALWVSLRAFREKRPFSLRDCFWIGVTSGCVLWVKYTLLGFYIGWFLVPLALMLKRRDIRSLLRSVGGITGGVAAASAPVLLYFVYNGALAELFRVYFYNNMFVYTQPDSPAKQSGLLENLKAGLVRMSLFSPVSLFLILAAFLLLWYLGQRAVFAHYTALVLFSFFFVAFSSVQHKYYTFILSVFAPLGAVLVTLLFKSVLTRTPPPRRLRSYVICICAVSVLYAAAATPNRYLMFAPRDELPQYRFSKIISQRENATLLNYGFLDGGFYTVCDIVPNCKYFCGLGISLPELKETQNEFVLDEKVDFVVTRDKLLPFSNYTCIDTASYYFEGTDRVYRLYIRRSLLS